MDARTSVAVDAADRELVELIMMMPLPDQNHADRPPGGLELRGQVEPFGVDSRKQHVIATVGQCIGYAAEYAHEEGVRYVLSRPRIVRNDDRDRLIALQPQVTRGGVDRVIERAGEFGDAGARCLVHERTLIEGPGDGRHRDAREPRDVLHLQFAVVRYRLAWPVLLALLRGAAADNRSWHGFLRGKFAAGHHHSNLAGAAGQPLRWQLSVELLPLSQSIAYNVVD